MARGKTDFFCVMLEISLDLDNTEIPLSEQKAVAKPDAIILRIIISLNFECDFLNLELAV